MEYSRERWAARLGALALAAALCLGLGACAKPAEDNAPPEKSIAPAERGIKLRRYEL